MRYTYTTPPGALISSNLGGCINRQEFNQSGPGCVALGWDQTTGAPVYLDITQAPHVLIAGTTGSGKSVMMHNIIVSLLYKNTPADAEIYLIDPKRVELSIYAGVPLVRGCVSEPAQALQLLSRLHAEMMKRYKHMERHGFRNVSQTTYKRIYIFIDELADLIYQSRKDTEKYISSIARLGRAAGVHLITATQRPTRDVLTGQIKLNIPARIALAVPAAVDSVTVLGHKGAEKLRGRGDGLLKRPETIQEQHIQGAYISDAELTAIIKHCAAQAPKSRSGWIFKNRR